MSLKQWIPSIVLVTACVCSTGCATSISGRLTDTEQEYYALEATAIPRELSKITFPKYRVEPPDILLIEAGQPVRAANDALKRGEQIVVQVENGVPLEVDPDIPQMQAQAEMPLQVEFRIINGPYVINPEGHVDFGPVYGTVAVEGLTIAEARDAIQDHLLRPEDQGGVGLLNPRVAVRLADIAGKQPITGEHLIRPDGTVSLGVYGSIPVAGRTLDEVTMMVADVLRNEGEQDPQVHVDVLAYNSKVIYVIQDGAGFGQEVTRLPWTGNETVLDAVAQVQGLSEVSSKQIWVARPAPSGTREAQILDVHWEAIAREGITTTNYQLAPGDRIYVGSDHLIQWDNALTKLFNPFERLLGTAIFTNQVQRQFFGGRTQGGGGLGGGFF